MRRDQGLRQRRQRCASVGTGFYGLGTRMFPHFCMFRQGRQGEKLTSLEKKEIDIEKKCKKKKNIKEIWETTLATLATLAEPLFMRVSRPPHPGATLATLAENHQKRTKC